MAGEALTLGYVVELDTTNDYPYVIKTTLDTSIALGVVLADAESGHAVNLCTEPGQVVVGYCSGAVTEGTFLCPDGANDGQVKTAASGDQICAVAMETTTAAGEFRMLFFHGWLKA